MNRDWSIASQKATTAIVEGLAFEVIRQFYARQNPPIKMLRIDYNGALDLGGKQAFDLVDGNGKTFEVKADHQAVQTGNFFLEHAALEHSKADYWIIFAFFAHVISRESLVELKNGPYRVVQGGDGLTATGTLVPLSELMKFEI
jgi:hypothetical protein